MSSVWNCAACGFINSSSAAVHCENCFISNRVEDDSSGLMSKNQMGKFSSKRIRIGKDNNHLNELLQNQPSSFFPEPPAGIYHNSNSLLASLHSERIARRSLTSSSSDIPLLSSKGNVSLKRHATESFASIPHSNGSHSSKNEDEKESNAENGVENCKLPSKFVIMTYNVWFREDIAVVERMKEIGRMVEKHDPDVICFQEVTFNILSLFQQSPWWKKYICSISSIPPYSSYFIIQLSKCASTVFKTHEYEKTIMGRNLLLSHIRNCNLLIATTHLESPMPAPPTWDQTYKHERTLQAREAFRILSCQKAANVILCGDMNWNEKDGDFPLPPSASSSSSPFPSASPPALLPSPSAWFDPWLSLHPSQAGFTYDCKANPMIKGGRFQARLDRFFCRLVDWNVDKIEMIGTVAIPDLMYDKERKVKGKLTSVKLPVLPSDHFGLLLTLAALKKEA